MPPCFPFIVLGFFDFSLLRTHFRLFTDVQRRIPRCVTRKVWRLWPKRESRRLRADIAQATLLTPRQLRLQPLTASPAQTVFQFGRANETMVSLARWFDQKSSPSKVRERHANGTTAMSLTSGFSSRGSNRAMVQLSPFCSVPSKT